MTRSPTASPLVAALATAFAFALSACQPAPDPQVAAAAQKARHEQAAAEMAKAFDAQYAVQNWELARAHGDVLMAEYPDSDAAQRIRPLHEEVRAKATAAAEARRTTALWSYDRKPVKGGEQLSAAIYAKANVDTDGRGAKPVRLIFRDHPDWGRSSYLVLEAGDFDCYRGCRLKVQVDDLPMKTMAGSRPDTDEAIAMFIEDERALWRMTDGAKTISVAFPVKAGGTRTAVFEVAGLNRSKLPAWK